MYYLEKISKLFDFDCYHLIEKLNKIGVIAGGCVVYAVNDFVIKESVSDVDVFINNKEKYIKILKEIKKNGKF